MSPHIQGAVYCKEACPPDLYAEAVDVRDLFGLHDWNIYLDEVEDPSGDGLADAEVDVNTRYLQAHIKIKPGLSAERRRHVLMHELLHVVLGPLARVLELAIARLPAGVRSIVEENASDVEEQTIERLTRALLLAIRPPAAATADPEAVPCTE